MSIATPENFRSQDEVAWLIESAINDGRGPHYLCVRMFTNFSDFDWSPDHEKALRLARKEDAEKLCAAVKFYAKDLFPAVVPYPRVTEHKWLETGELVGGNRRTSGARIA